MTKKASYQELSEVSDWSVPHCNTITSTYIEIKRGMCEESHGSLGHS